MNLRHRAVRKSRRLAKNLRSRLRSSVRGAKPETRAVFIFGMQRSGTRIPLTVANRSPEVMAYGEGATGFYDGVLLADLSSVSSGLETSHFSTVMLKPICDSHRADEILEHFPGSRALWIFRHYRDTVSSAAAKWPTAPEGIKKLADGDREAAGWWAGGLLQEDFELVRQHYHSSLSPEGAHALLWYLRNTFYFRLGLNEREDVLLIKYEDLVQQPAKYFSELFRFLEVPFKESFVSGVYNSSVGMHPIPDIPESVEELCSELHEKLKKSYRRQRAGFAGSK